MKIFVITSMRQSAGKTSLIIGLAKALNKNIGYLKPFGARLLYKKKRLWDYDAAIMSQIFNLDENPEDMSIGFHHARLLYSLDEERTKEKLLESVRQAGRNKEMLFVEAGKDIVYGSSVYLDAIALTRTLAAKLVIVASGSDETISDDLGFLAKYIRREGLDFMGVIINKVANIDDFKTVYMPGILQLGMPVLGVVPAFPELNFSSVRNLAERMFARILAGESGLHRQVRNIVVGSMGEDEAMKSPLFKDHHQVVIASGDRGDLILMSLQNNAAAVILTNNILPSPVVIAKAEDLGIPLLLVQANTHEAVKQINGIEPLPTRDEGEKIGLMEQIIRDYVDLNVFA